MMHRKSRAAVMKLFLSLWGLADILRKNGGAVLTAPKHRNEIPVPI